MHSSTSRVFYRCIIIYIAITGVISSPVSWAAKSSFQFEQSEYLVTEGERVSLSIVRGVSDTAEKLYYQTQDGTASHGADYQRIRKARLDFLEGETSKTIAVDTLQDTEPEENENFTVVILPVGGVERVETNVIIEDDDATPLGGEFNLESLNYNVEEGGQVTAVITRSQGMGPASVRVGTNGVTAVHNEDYWGFSDQEMLFADGETQKSVNVQTIDDAEPESGEIFELRLSTPSSGYDLGPGAIATVTIEDNDPVAATGSATLSWTPPTTNTDDSALVDLAGYRIKYGTSPGSYPNIIDVTNEGLTTYVVENLSANTYYFVMTAYNVSNVESENSNEASAVIE
jgi:hypothetical protein